MARTTNDGLYSNLYDKDMNLMRKLMNLDEFQCPSSGNNNLAAVNNSDASKQFHPYTNGGIFNGKMLSNSTANFAFPYDKQQHQHQHMNGGMRNHDGLLKQCYDFPATATAKTEPLDDNFNAGFATKKSSSQNALFSTPSGGGFMNQFAHHDYSNHQAFTAKINEINNNNSGGGIVVKLENGGNDYNAMQQQLAKSEIICPRGASSTMVVSKTEPNEFRSSSCKDNNNHVDNTDDERKTSLHSHDHDSNDGFTQL